jgi:hypothetical protein
MQEAMNKVSFPSTGGKISRISALTGRKTRSSPMRTKYIRYRIIDNQSSIEIENKYKNFNLKSKNIVAWLKKRNVM